MLGQASNPMLAQAEQGIESKVAPELHDALSKTVHAGLTIMYAPQTAEARNRMLSQSKDPADDAGKGAARLISNLYRQSDKKMPTDIVVPAAMIFGFEYLDLVAKSGRVQITPDLLAKATQSVADNVLPLFGVTPEKLQQMIAEAKNKATPNSTAVTPAVTPAPAGIIASAQRG